MYLTYIFCYSLLVALASSASFMQPDLLWLDEGEVCQKSEFSKANYVCKPLDKCTTVIEDIKDNEAFPTICSIKGKMTVVCCPPEWMTREDRLARVKTKKILPGITLHFKSDKNNLAQDKLIIYNSRLHRLRGQVLTQNRL